MDIGLQRAGFDHRFFAEIDPYCRTTLATRFPGVTVYEDVHDVDASAGYVDLLCGGFPCQDISVAGKRAGLAGDRSGLFFEFMRIVGALRPRAILIENVEGLYSSGSPKGADFGVVLDALAELGYLASWRTLDAQHFGVPQRRRRVFVCAVLDGDPGAERLGEVFAVEQGSSGDSPTSDPAWPFTAAPTGGGAGHGGGRVVGALTGRSVTRLDEQCVGGGQIVTAAVTAKWAKGSGGPSGDEIQNVVWHSIQRTGKNAEVVRHEDDATYYIEDCERGPVKAGGAGGSPPRTDRLPLMAYRKARRAQSNEDFETWVKDDRSNTLNQFDASAARTTHAVVTHQVVGALKGSPGRGWTNSTESCADGHLVPLQTVTAFAQNQREEVRDLQDRAGALSSAGGKHQATYVTYNVRPEYGNGADLRVDEAEIHPTLAQQTHLPGYDRGIRVLEQATVRRLTPMECERLMGWPDGWTDVPWRKKDVSPDSRRYAACGNGVVAPVAYWIGARLAEVLAL